MAQVLLIFSIISLFQALQLKSRYKKLMGSPAIYGRAIQLLSEVPAFKDKKQTKLKSVTRVYGIEAQTPSGMYRFQYNEVSGPDGKSEIQMGQPLEFHMDPKTNQPVRADLLQKQASELLKSAGIEFLVAIGLYVLVSFIV